MKLAHKLSNTKTQDWLKNRVDAGYLPNVENSVIIHEDQVITKKNFLDDAKVKVDSAVSIAEQYQTNSLRDKAKNIIYANNAIAPSGFIEMNNNISFSYFDFSSSFLDVFELIEASSAEQISSGDGIKHVDINKISGARHNILNRFYNSINYVDMMNPSIAESTSELGNTTTYKIGNIYGIKLKIKNGDGLFSRDSGGSIKNNLQGTISISSGTEGLTSAMISLQRELDSKYWEYAVNGQVVKKVDMSKYSGISEIYFAVKTIGVSSSSGKEYLTTNIVSSIPDLNISDSMLSRVKDNVPLFNEKLSISIDTNTDSDITYTENTQSGQTSITLSHDAGDVVPEVFVERVRLVANEINLEDLGTI